jgi:hypothetical protein
MLIATIQYRSEARIPDAAVLRGRITETIVVLNHGKYTPGEGGREYIERMIRGLIFGAGSGRAPAPGRRRRCGTWHSASWRCCGRDAWPY